MTDSTAFWGAIVQIIPVLALTFVVEAVVFRLPTRDEVSAGLAEWASLDSDERKRRVVAAEKKLGLFSGVAPRSKLLPTLSAAVGPLYRSMYGFAWRIYALLLVVSALLAAEFIGWIVLAAGVWDNAATRAVAISAAMAGLSAVLAFPIARSAVTTIIAMRGLGELLPIKDGELVVPEEKSSEGSDAPESST